MLVFGFYSIATSFRFLVELGSHIIKNNACVYLNLGYGFRVLEVPFQSFVLMVMVRFEFCSLNLGSGHQCGEDFHSLRVLNG